MLLRMLRTPLLLALMLCAAPALAAEQILMFDGQVDEGEPDHMFVPFEVPAGTVEIEIRHDDLSEDNILDWGANDPDGFRGWAGGTLEPAIFNAEAATRGYVPGAIQPGTWAVVIGKAKIETPPGQYHIEVVLRDVVTLAPQTDRQPYAPPPALDIGPRWYAGDFHVHSHESSDTRAIGEGPFLDEIATFSRGRGLDFAVITDHNIVTQLDYYATAQASSPDFLFVPGVEYTTYDGHANGIGATQWVDHKIGQPGVTIEAAAQAFAAQGAVFSINHPELRVGNLCIGCGWDHQLPLDLVGGVEMGSGGWDKTGGIMGDNNVAFWDGLCAQGFHITALGGSDDHRAGVDEGPLGSPIGNPTTMVFADELSVHAIVDAVRAGRTVVKMTSNDDPMIELDPLPGSSIAAPEVTLRVRVIGAAAGDVLRWVQNGETHTQLPIDGPDFTHELSVTPPATGEARWRVEVRDGTDDPRTITSHVWLSGGGATPPSESGGCGCRIGLSHAGAGGWLLLVAATAYLRSRQRARTIAKSSQPPT
ncbi:MAG TPA: CehA/McbA family metallohydrolase [Polyangiaceae bacterium]|nr:CehA/McbA family metallohydrolase [Polyangiaceae bacterium]